MPKVSQLKPSGAPRYYVLDADRRPVEISETQWRAQDRGQRQLVAEDEVPHGRVWTRFSKRCSADRFAPNRIRRGSEVDRDPVLLPVSVTGRATLFLLFASLRGFGQRRRRRQISWRLGR